MQFTKQKTVVEISEKKATEESQRGNIWIQLMEVLSAKPLSRCLSHPVKILQTDPRKNFNIDIQLEGAVHGYLTPDQQQRASLLVFGIQLVSLRRKSPFKRMALEAKIMETQGPSSSRPEIVAHAPFVFEEALKTEEIEVEDTSQVKDTMNANVDFGGAKLGIGKEWVRSKASKSVHKYFAKGASAIKVDDDGKRSGIWWNVKQSTIPDAQDNAGIDPNYRFAVLLTRGRHDKSVFKVKLNLEVHAGMGYLLENNFSHVIHVKNLEIDPRM